MNLLMIIATVLMIGLAVYSRWTEPVLPYGEERQRPLLAGPSFVLGSVYGLVVLLWLFYGSALTVEQREARTVERQRIARSGDALLRARAKRLAIAERQLRIEDQAKRLADQEAEWKRQRARAVDQRAVEEMSAVVLEGKSQGPCHTLRGCVCGLASQFSDSRILARRYRRWCRGFRSLEGEWM